SDNVWTSDVGGHDARAVTHEKTNLLAGPTWDPSGQGFVAAWMSDSAAHLHNSELRWYSWLGGKGQVVVAEPTSGENVHEARFSPDGRYLYYTEKVTPPSTSIVYIDAN